MRICSPGLARQACHSHSAGATAYYLSFGGNWERFGLFTWMQSIVVQEHVAFASWERLKELRG